MVHMLSEMARLENVPHYGNQPKLVSLESYDHGESNVVGCKDFGSELIEDAGFYQETINGA